ncbi:hypothetical protein TNCV_87651 [Trichonephila clavipes]|nr:hypothetical protein TNCV_87651 [Trichonephila clavipes]
MVAEWSWSLFVAGFISVMSWVQVLAPPMILGADELLHVNPVRGRYELSVTRLVQQCNAAEVNGGKIVEQHLYLIEEVADLVRQINLEAYCDDIQELLESYVQELVIVELIEMQEQD